MKYYNFIFYKFYKFMLKIGKEDIPELKAVAFFSMWLNFNLITLVFLPSYFHLLSQDLYIPKLLGVLTFFLLLAINYYLYIKNRNYINIKTFFETSGKLSTLEGSITTTIFLIFPFINLFYILAKKFIF